MVGATGTAMVEEKEAMVLMVTSVPVVGGGAVDGDVWQYLWLRLVWV